MENVKVKLLVETPAYDHNQAGTVAQALHPAGAVIEVSADLARAWILDGRAELADGD